MQEEIDLYLYKEFKQFEQECKLLGGVASNYVQVMATPAVTNKLPSINQHINQQLIEPLDIESHQQVFAAPDA